LKDGNIANVNGLRQASGQYKLQRGGSTNTLLSTASVANPEAGVKFSLPSGGLKDLDTEGWEKSDSNRKFAIFT
jgi:hypothetical protein